MSKVEIPNLYIFIGPKGAGKSYLGDLINSKLGVKFLRVEDIWLIEFKKYGFGEQYIEAGLQRSSEKIIDTLKTGVDLIIESAGWSDLYKRQIELYKPYANIRLIKVNAPVDLCVDRSLTRNKANHVPVPDDQTRKIHALSQKLELEWELEVFNDSGNAASQFVENFETRFLTARSNLVMR